MKTHMYGLILCLFGPALQAQFVKADSIDWLIGNWKGRSQEGIVIEKWKRMDNDSFIGEGYIVVQGDSVVREHIVMMPFSKFWVYIAQVNQQPPVLFTLVKNENGKLIFENKEHDFPQRIMYSRLDEDRLKIRVEGYVGRTLNKDEYELVRSP